MPALRLLAEILRQPAFPTKEFELLKQEQLTEVENNKSEPQQKAVTAFTRSVSRELGIHGICVNTLAPGFTITGLQNDLHVEQSRAGAIQRRAIKREQVPEDLVGTLVYLASDASDFLTGQVLAVDGGANNT